MRLKSYINEEIDKDTLLNNIEIIYDKCMPYIKDLVNNGWGERDEFLLSGRDYSTSIIVGDIRKDRNPVGTNYDKHKFFDNLFYKEFKIKGRSNTLFCTGAIRTAKGYGDTAYIIFPVGKYKFLYSYKVFDLYTSSMIISIEWKIEKKIKSKKDNFNSDIVYSDLYKDYRKELADSINKKIIKSYRNTNIVNAIRSENEIMLSSKSYIGFDWYKYKLLLKSYIIDNGVNYPTKERFDEWYNNRKIT